MKKMKKLFALLAVLCVVFSLCACGGNSDSDENADNDVNVENQTDDDLEDADVEDDSDDEEDTTAATFKVTVVDEGGNPVQGCMVQVCKESCVPAITDANGVATFSIAIEDGHHLAVSSCPAGYEYTGEAEIDLEAGATEYTLTLKAVQ